MDNRNTQFNGKLKFKVEVHVRDEYCQEANGSELSNHYQVFDVLCDLWSTSRQNECSNFPILLLCQGIYHWFKSLMNIWSKSLTDCMKIGMPNSVISQSVLMGIVGIILMITMVTNCNTCYAYAVLFLQLLSIMEWCLCNCLKHVCRFLHSLIIACVVLL